MAKELAFALINPYTIRKSRTGGVIARLMSRTQLDLVAARMYGPSRELAENYAALIREADSESPGTCQLISDYILRCYSPDPETGKTHRVLMLLFEGEDAVRKVWEATGSATLRWGHGETIRDTFGDYVVDGEDHVQYFEPAVLVAPNRKRAAATLKLWARYADADGGLVDLAADVPEGETVEKTLVLIKPDNFRFRSSRPGNIIDVLSRSGLRIIGMKKFCMTVAQAECFYGPVRESLRDKFKKVGTDRAVDALQKEFGFRVPRDVVAELCNQLGPAFAESQFDSIVMYMTGYRPSECTQSEKMIMGSEDCLALVYDGVDAVQTIRNILGPTDPQKAEPGSVRREFGSNIMVNAAHASDSAENAEREIGIIDVKGDTVRPWIDRYYGNIVAKMVAKGKQLPNTGCHILRKVRKAFTSEDAAPSSGV